MTNLRISLICGDIPIPSIMTTPPSLSSYGLPTSFSNYSHSHSSQRGSYQRGNSNYRGRGQSRGRGTGRGNHFGVGPSHRGGFKYDGRQNTGYNNNNSDGQQGDIKTGLFRDSFLEDPWRELVPRKTGLRAGVENTPRTNVPRAMDSGQGKPKERPYETTEKVDDEDAEGEIVLSDSDEDTDQVEGDTGIGLGDGLVEAARNITN